MDETDGQRRRLPPWMLGVAAVKSEMKEEIDTVINEEKTCVGSPNRHINSRPRRAARLEKETLIPQKADPDSNGSSLLVKCESKKTKRKVIENEVKCDGNTQETKENLEVGDSSMLVKCESKRTKRKIRTQGAENREDEVGRRNKESAPKKRQRMKKSFETSLEETEDPSSNEDDGDLTMEDLISIAKEFVEDGSSKEMQQQSDKEKQKLQTQFAGVDDMRTTINKETDSHHNSTGDPAQDMLELLLGPLLKNNPLDNDNKKVELITDDMTFAHQSKMEKQKDVCGEKQVVPLMKKKGSLRDKVAALLD